MRAPLALAALASLIGLTAAACGGPRGAARDGTTAAGGTIVTRAPGDHPRLVRVQRAGDPSSALAVALVHDHGARASAWLGPLLDARLPPGPGPRIPPTVSGLGIVLGRRAITKEEAAVLVRAFAAALTREVTDAELTRLGAERAAVPAPRVWSGPADAAVGACSGELGTREVAARPTAPELEALRRELATTSRAAFAAVGSRKVLDAAEAALAALPPWAEGSPVDDAWPAAGSGAQEVIGASLGPSAPLLSVSLRVSSPARVLHAARRLGDPDALLGLRASRLDPAFRVERIIGTARPRGACLRVDLAPRDGIDPGSLATGRAAALALGEARRALAEASDQRWAMDSPVLEAEDPAEAARVAAWNAVSEQGEPGPERVAVHYAAASTVPEDLGATVHAAGTAGRTPTVDVRGAVEAGQGEMWLLAGSPCATDSETGQDAGAAAFMVRALVRAAVPVSGIRFEPWVSSEGIGLLAHGAAEGPTETAREQATRLGDALGRALVTTPLDGTRAAETRLELLRELSPELGPLWPYALDALSPGRPSWLDPRGTWQAVSEQPLPALDVGRRAFIRGPLRLGVLARSGGDTFERARAALERWLAPEREREKACGPRPPLVSRPGAVEIRDLPATGPARALVGVPIQALPGGGLPREAAWTADLLGRQGGWLDRALAAAGLALGAEPRLLGGGGGGALVVEIAADGDASRAADQVRALFARLAAGAATREDAVRAQEAEARASLTALLDPRYRVVRLLSGKGPGRTPDVASLRRFHAEVFSAERHVVVLTRPAGGRGGNAVAPTEVPRARPAR